MRVESTRPWDLLVVAVATLATVLVVFTNPWPPLRVALGLPFVLFLPGYALVAALFPERHKEYKVAKGEDADDEEEVSEGLDALERVALAFGLSIAVVPLLGLGLNYTPWGIRLIPIIATVSAFTLTASAIAAWRRARLPADERLRFAFTLEPPAWREYSLLDKALTVGLALSILTAGVALAYVVTTPSVGERFTEFYVLGPEGMAEGYPTNLTVGEEGHVILGVVNREHANVTYTARLVAETGHFENATGNRTWVSESNRTLDTWTIPLALEEKWEENVTFTLDAPGTYRVRFELDKPGAEEQPYRRLHLWVTVAPAPAGA